MIGTQSEERQRPWLGWLGVVALYFAYLTLLALLGQTRPPPGRVANEASLTPLQAFARTSEINDADEANFTERASFLSAGFSPGQALPFEVGTDSPAQPLRGHPQGVAVSHNGRKLYVTLPGNEAEPLNKVVVLSPDDGKILSTIEVGQSPFGLLVHPQLDLLLVSHQYSDYLSVIDMQLDREVHRLPLETPQGSRFFAQKMAWVRGGQGLVVTNRMTDSLLAYDFSPRRLRFKAEVPLWVTNTPVDTGEEPLQGPFSVNADSDHLAPAVQGLTGNSNPPDLRRKLRNVNPLDVVVLEGVRLGPFHVTDLAYVGTVNGLGVAVVDLRAGKQIASLDMNSPVLGLAKYEPRAGQGQKRLVFAATGSRFALAFDDVLPELAVIAVDDDPFVMATRYTATSGMPVGPSGGPATGTLVSTSGQAPYLSAFATPTAARTNNATNAARDQLPELLSGALPAQMAVTDDFLALSYQASDQVEFFSIQSGATVPADLLTRKALVFTNSDQVGSPTTALQTKAANPFNTQGLLEYAMFANGSEISGEVSATDPLLGQEVPGFFDGRMPAAVAADPHTRRIYVANRLGESVSIFDYGPDGKFGPARIPVIDVRTPATLASPPFPATLAELGEDFYTSSRVALNRRQSCLGCHPNINTDSKVWAVSAAPGNVRRRVQTNRNLRDTPPFGFAGSRSNLEICARNLRSFVPDIFFGESLGPNHHAFRDANSDGTKDYRDRGRPQADINRDAMYVFERTGIGFEYVSAAIAAFLEVEPRLFPNPFRNPDRSLKANVPMNLNDGKLVVGNAIEGEKVFDSLACATCHTGTTFTNNATSTRFTSAALSPLVLNDLSDSGVLDGVVLSHEESVFGPGSSQDYVDPRLVRPSERRADKLINGFQAFPLERSLENAIDKDQRVFSAKSLAFTTYTYTFPQQLPCSLFSEGSRSPRRQDQGWCREGGRLLANEPEFLPDPALNTTGGDGRNVNVPSLRNTWEMSPYLHHGRASTVLEVLEPTSEFNYRRDPDTGDVASGPYLNHGRMAELAGKPQAQRDLAAYLFSIE